jgi:hypothetical protein
LGPHECPDPNRRPGECRLYRTDTGDVLLLEGYDDTTNLYVYDLDSNGRSDILKWDLGRDWEFEIIEYDLDGDGILDYAVADVNISGQFDDREIYSYRGGRWRPLFPGVLPFPFVPPFPYG